jgi:hypothetical protein
MSSASCQSARSTGDTTGTSPLIMSSDDDEPQHPIVPLGTKRYVLLCVNNGIHRINLAHVDVTHIGHDEVLFQQIKAAYAELRSNQARNILIVARTMQYIEVLLILTGTLKYLTNKSQFELILRQKSGECIGNFEKDSIPPEKKVLEQEYAFKPCPLTIGKLPIPPHVFMHSFQNPGDHTGSLAIGRFPKKLRQRLSCGNNQLSVPIGWGIYIVEGYNWKLIIWCTGSGFLATFILVIIWCLLKNDIQGGIGIGQYSIAAIALVLAMFASEKM